MTRNGHRHQGCNRIHRQRAVSGGDVVVVSLRAVIQRVGERVGGFTRVELAARHIVGRTLAVREAVATHRHVAVGQRRAVVGLAVRGGGQRHRALVDGNHAVVGRDIRIERLVFNGVRERIGNARRVVGDTGRRCDAQRVGGRQSEDGAVAVDVRHRIAVVGHRVAREGVRLAVILPGVGVGLDDERIDVVGHRQRAITLGNLVVGGLGTRVQGIFERIVTEADVGLAGREGIGGTLARHKPALHGERRGAVHQGVAVVSLRQVGGSEGHRAFRDAEREGGIHTAVVRAGGAGNHIQRAEISDGRDFGGEGAAAVNAVGHRRGSRAVCRTGGAGAVQRGTVILFLALARQRDDKRVARRDGHPTVRHGEGHRTEVRIHIGELVLRPGRSAFQVHVRSADILTLGRGITTEGEVIHVVKRIGNAHVIAGHALLGAVINLRVRMTRNDYLNIDWRDGLVAVRHVEGHLVEVRVGISEHRIRKAHIGLAVGVGAFHHVGSGRGGRTAEGEIRLRVERSADVRHRVAAHAVLVAIVRRCIVGTHDSHRRVDWRDDLITVRHVKRHRRKVRVGVGKLAGGETHVSLSVVVAAFHHVRSGGRSRAVEGEVDVVARHLVQVGAGSGGVARHSMRLAVVGSGVVRTHDSDRRIDLVDCLVTIDHHEVHVREVGVGIGELVLCTGSRTLQTHIRGTSIGSGSLSRAIEGEVVHRVERIADGDIIASHTMFRTVVSGGVVMAGDGHHHLIESSDGLEAVRHLEVHLVEVRRIRVGELFGQKTHIGGTGQCTFCRNHTVHQSGGGGWGEREVGGGVERIAVVHIIARHHMFLTIKGGRVVMAGDGHRHVDLVDGLVTVRHNKCHRTEVRVRVGELVLRSGRRTLQAHVGGTGIGALGGDNTVHINRICGRSEDKVMLHIIQCGVSHSRVTANVMLVAVIRQSAVRTHDGDRHINRVYLLVTVGHVEGHLVEIRVGIGEHRIRKTHIGLAVGVTAFHHIGSRSGRIADRASEGEVVHGIERIADGDIVTRHRVCSAVVIRGVVVTRNRHRHINRVDGLVTVRHVEGHRAEVGVRVGELVRRTGITTLQTHIRGTGISALGGDDTIDQGCIRGRSEGKITGHIVQRGVSRGRVARHDVLITIVIRSVVRTRDSDGGGNRGDFLVTVNHHEAHVREVGVRIGELSLGEAHIGLSVSVRAFHHVGTGGRGRAAEGKVVIHIVQRGVGLSGVARHGVLRAVIGFRVRLTGNGHRHARERVDGLVAVVHDKAHLGEVRVRVVELSGGETHVGGADILAGGRDDIVFEVCTARRREGEAVVHIIEVGAGRGGIARHGMERTVIVGGVVGTGDGDGDASERGDLQPAVYNFERHIVVRVRRAEL